MFLLKFIYVESPRLENPCKTAVNMSVPPTFCPLNKLSAAHRDRPCQIFLTIIATHSGLYAVNRLEENLAELGRPGLWMETD